MSVATSFSSVVVTELHGYVDTLVGFVRQLPNLVWVYGTIVALCFYIFHRLIETRSEKNNIWEIASLDKKIETKLLEKEKEEEKQKDKLERRKLRAKKQRIMLKLHPSIALTNPSYGAQQRGEDEAKDGSSDEREPASESSAAPESERKRARNRRKRLARARRKAEVNAAVSVLSG